MASDSVDERGGFVLQLYLAAAEGCNRPPAAARGFAGVSGSLERQNPNMPADLQASDRDLDGRPGKKVPRAALFA